MEIVYLKQFYNGSSKVKFINHSKFEEAFSDQPNSKLFHVDEGDGSVYISSCGKIHVTDNWGCKENK